MDMGLLLAFMAAVTVLSVVPGPDMFYVVANGISAGPRAGLVAACGMSTGLAVHTVAAALGLSVLLHAFPFALDVIRVLGIGFLLYLAISALRTSMSTSDTTAQPIAGKSLGRIYLLAVLTNLANPKVILFYLAFFPQFTSTQAAWPMSAQLLALGAVFIAIGIVVDGTAGFAAGRLSDLLLRKPGVRRWLDRLSAAVFGGLAVRLAVDDSV
ncbi:MAG: LysE family translocator [Pseudonocardiaceae bacterium]|nr:LysE family translocator [Pseudonocardiaceae bacterium]